MLTSHFLVSNLFHTSIRDGNGALIFQTKIHRDEIQRVKIPVWGKGSPKRSLPKHTLCELGLYRASEICWRERNRPNCSVKGKFAVCTEATLPGLHSLISSVHTGHSMSSGTWLHSQRATRCQLKLASQCAACTCVLCPALTFLALNVCTLH